MACRSGCLTKDHASYGECAKAANVRIGATISSDKSEMYSQTKRELKDYRAARASGIQPEGTTQQKITEAYAATEMLGRPYNADVDPPANTITTKKAAAFVNKTSDGVL